MANRLARIAIICAAWVLVADARLGLAADSSALNVRTSQTPYCGVSSLYGAIRLFGRTIEYADVLKPEYISTTQGSTINDLQLAARDLGFYTAAIGRLTTEDLRTCQLPVILHTKADAGATRYDHFLLFVETDADDALILDAPFPLKRVPLRDLNRVWDGAGLIVSDRLIREGQIGAASRARLAVYAVVVAMIVLGVHQLKGTVGRFRSRGFSRGGESRQSVTSASAQACALLLFALIVAGFYHRFTSEGFLARADATTEIDDKYFASTLPQVSVLEARAALGNGSVLVDARLSSDFTEEHIEGTLNIPIGTSQATRAQVLAGVAKEKTVIVFCKSAGCGYSSEVAKHLARDGFTDVRIFRGGWDQWKATYEKQS